MNFDHETTLLTLAHGQMNFTSRPDVSGRKKEHSLETADSVRDFTLRRSPWGTRDNVWHGAAFTADCLQSLGGCHSSWTRAVSAHYKSYLSYASYGGVAAIIGVYRAFIGASHHPIVAC